VTVEKEKKKKREERIRFDSIGARLSLGLRPARLTSEKQTERMERGSKKACSEEEEPVGIP